MLASCSALGDSATLVNRDGEKESWMGMRFGRIGAGLAGPLLGGALAEHPGGAELVAVASRRESSAQAFAQRYAIPRVYADWRELLADPEIDAVCITSPTGSHAEMPIAAARAGGASWAGLVGVPNDVPRLKIAETLGADATYTSSEEALAGIKAVTEGLGPEVVLEAAGTPEGMKLAVDLVRVGGTVVYAGLPPAKIVPIEAIRVTRDEVVIRGVEGNLPADRRRWLRVVFTRFFERLRALGVSEDDLKLMSEENPRRILAW